MASFTAAGTAYATWGQPMIPFFIFYSMFGFQRVGDLIWSFGDQRGRGFLLGATAGRTTLTGEGLQHCDGQSQLLASTVPELPRLRPRVRVRDGGDHPRRHRAHVRRRARGLLLLPHPLQRELPDAGDARGRRGRHRARALPVPRGAGGAAVSTARRSSPAAPRCSPRSTRSRCSPTSTTSPPTCGARRATSCCARTRCRTERWNRLHPTEPARTPYVTELLGDAEGPIVAVTDFMKAVPDQIAPFVPQPFVVARHRRLRLLRHAGRAAAPLRGRRAEHRRRGAPRARRDRARSRHEVVARGHRALRHRPRQGRPAPHLT